MEQRPCFHLFLAVCAGCSLIFVFSITVAEQTDTEEQDSRCRDDVIESFYNIKHHIQSSKEE